MYKFSTVIMEFCFTFWLILENSLNEKQLVDTANMMHSTAVLKGHFILLLVKPLLIKFSFPRPDIPLRFRLKLSCSIWAYNYSLASQNNLPAHLQAKHAHDFMAAAAQNRNCLHEHTSTPRTLQFMILYVQTTFLYKLDIHEAMARSWCTASCTATYSNQAIAILLSINSHKD